MRLPPPAAAVTARPLEAPPARQVHPGVVRGARAAAGL